MVGKNMTAQHLVAAELAGFAGPVFLELAGLEGAGAASSCRASATAVAAGFLVAALPWGEAVDMAGAALEAGPDLAAVLLPELLPAAASCFVLVLAAGLCRAAAAFGAAAGLLAAAAFFLVGGAAC